MSSAKPAEALQPQGVRNMRTQKVDVVASFLLSMLLVIGLLVFMLFVIWLTQTFTWKAGDIKIEEERIAGRGDHAEGFERDIEPPGEEEAEDLTEPTLEQKLEAVTDVASSVAASIDTIDSNSAAVTAGSGRGDSRPPGPLGEGDNIVPRFERWELKFISKDVKAYAIQLDFYKIELGCIGGGAKLVDYAGNFSSSPQKRSGKGGEEKRLYFMWKQEGPLVAYDRQLLGQAGVNTQRRQLLKFIPKELEDRLAQTEMKYAISKGHSTVKEIAKTIFESQAAGAGYEFVVVEQRYRTVAPTEPKK